MNVFERLSDNPSFQGAMKETVMVGQTLTPLCAEILEPAREPNAEDILIVPDVQVNEEDCQPCEAYLNGWCLLAKPESQYSIRFLKACPLTISVPQPDQSEHKNSNQWQYNRLSSDS